MDIKEIALIVLYTIIVELLTILLYKMFAQPKRKLIEGAEQKTSEELDINNRIFLHMTDGIIAFDIEGKIIDVGDTTDIKVTISYDQSSIIEAKTLNFKLGILAKSK